MDQKASTKEKHDFSCLMVEIPSNIGQKIVEWGRKHIPDDWINEEAGGRELQSHCTLKYGLVTPNLEDIEPFIPDETFNVSLGKVSRFTTNPDYDVIFIKVEGGDLHDLNHEISVSLENDEEHPTYTPHCTVAYVLKGKGAELEGDSTFDGTEVEIDTVLWSSKNGDKAEIPIEKEKWMRDETENA